MVQSSEPHIYVYMTIVSIEGLSIERVRISTGRIIIILLHAARVLKKITI